MSNIILEPISESENVAILELVAAQQHRNKQEHPLLVSFAQNAKHNRHWQNACIESYLNILKACNCWHCGAIRQRYNVDQIGIGLCYHRLLLNLNGNPIIQLN